MDASRYEQFEIEQLKRKHLNNIFWNKLEPGVGGWMLADMSSLKLSN